MAGKPEYVNTEHVFGKKYRRTNRTSVLFLVLNAMYFLYILCYNEYKFAAQ